MSGAGECFLGPVNGAQPCNRQPLSPRGPSPAPRAPAWELAPDAVAIETSSPHKNHRNKKEAPEMMGPSPAEPWTWARPSTLGHPGTLTWGRGCLQRPGSTWGGPGRSPSQGGSSFPSLCLAGQGPVAQLRGALPSEGVHGSARPNPPPVLKSLGPACWAPVRMGSVQGPCLQGEWGTLTHRPLGERGGCPAPPGPVPNSPLPPTRLPPTLSRGRLASGPRHQPGARTRAGMGPAPPAPEAPAPRPPPRPHPAPPARPGRGLTASALSWAKMAKVESRSQRQRVRRASRGTVRQPRHDQGPSCGGAGEEGLGGGTHGVGLGGDRGGVSGGRPAARPPVPAGPRPHLRPQPRARPAAGPRSPAPHGRRRATGERVSGARAAEPWPRARRAPRPPPHTPPPASAGARAGVGARARAQRSRAQRSRGRRARRGRAGRGAGGRLRPEPGARRIAGDLGTAPASPSAGWSPLASAAPGRGHNSLPRCLEARDCAFPFPHRGRRRTRSPP